MKSRWGVMIAAVIASGSFSTAVDSNGADARMVPKVTTSTGVLCKTLGSTRVTRGVSWKCIRRGKTLRWQRTSSSVPVTTTSIKPKVLERAVTDRPGAGRWDVKYLYVTFKGGPDNRRDETGEITGMASEVNRYFALQNPGYKLRYDTFEGALDVQHLPLPITNEEFRDLFLRYRPGSTLGPPLEQYIETWLKGAGLEWRAVLSGMRTENQRAYVWVVEGSRGPEFVNDRWVKMVCNQWDNEWSSIVMRFVRDLDGNVCQPITTYWLPTDAQWKAAWSESEKRIIGAWPPTELLSQYKWWGQTIIRGLIIVLILQPGCVHVDQSTVAGFWDSLSEGDMLNYAAAVDRPLGHPALASLDPARKYYFKINNGPWVGDRCHDAQYSPYWEAA